MAANTPLSQLRPEDARPLGDVVFSMTLHDDGARLIVESEQLYVYIGPATGAGERAAGEAIALFVMAEVAKRSKR